MFPARRLMVLAVLVLSLGACKKHGKGDGSGGGGGGGGGKGNGKGVGKVVVVPDAAVAKADVPEPKGEGNGEGGGGENDGERPMPTADLKITIVGPAGETVFTGDKLAALPTSHAPIGDMDTPGWTLGQVLDAAGVKVTEKVVVYGAENANLILDAADFDPTKAVLFIKLNRSGQLRFRLFRKAGDTFDIAGELRGIVRIELK
jgi:hypothetical protein